ncbi:MAG: aminotransferase class I/II-fold pyridoxal phosphate-dependent enzyme [Bacteroides sp.]|nr:aminotransferase class I/II-fold pyridoxal phosphate-dependent enzyme [Bacteroides sp.]
MIEGHGDDLHRYAGRIRHNFSSNILSGVDHAGLRSHLIEALGRIGHYPPPAPHTLCSGIARKWGVSPDNIAVTNGVCDCIYRIAQLNAGRRSDIVAPTFREYQDACRRYAHEIRFISSPDEVADDAECLWVCSPDNPTGRVWDADSLLALAAADRGRLIVIDQAYSDYTSLRGVTPEECVEAANIILLKSLTKRYSVPGLRVGYAVASCGVADSLRGLGIPWEVNTVTLAGAEYLLAHDGDYVIPAASLHAEIERMAEKFRRIGIHCFPTDCNFMLCRLPKGRARDLKEWLALRHGLLIRDASNFEGLSEEYFRVAAQRPDANDELTDRIKEWIYMQ